MSSPSLPSPTSPANDVVHPDASRLFVFGIFTGMALLALVEVLAAVAWYGLH